MRRDQYFGSDAIHRLTEIVETRHAKRILLVTGQRSYEDSGASEVVERILDSHLITRYWPTANIPDLNDVEAGISAYKELSPDLMIAVGGGSIIDLAKLIRVCSSHEAAPVDLASGSAEVVTRGLPLVAIPTTAGSGSEATHFAVVYVDKKKYSVAHEYVMPDIAIVDPTLTYSMSPRQTAICGFDALSQSIESIWSVNSSDYSMRLASEAIELVVSNLYLAVSSPSASSREAMSRAANLAGQSINITKTTAPHALSYMLTVIHSIPHGHAVALTLGSFLEFNSAVSARDINDPRGVSHVHDVIERICGLMGADTAVEGRQVLQHLMETVGLDTCLRPYGIETAADCERIVEDVNVERLSNNPRKISRSQMSQMLLELI